MEFNRRCDPLELRIVVHGCEVSPALRFLRVAFPELTFTEERTLPGAFGDNTSWVIFSTFKPSTAADIDHVRSVATAFLDGFKEGFQLGFEDANKYGT